MHRVGIKFGFGFVIFILATLALSQQQPATSKKASAPSKQSTGTKPKASPSTQEFGKSYDKLRPEQKKLIDDLVRRYNQTTGNKLVPAEGYDAARMSVRTTFDAVTHALLT